MQNCSKASEQEPHEQSKGLIAETQPGLSSLF